MMFKHSVLLAALSGLAASSELLNSLPDCAKPCFEQAQALVGCDLSQVSCLCSSIPILMDNADVKDCLGTCPTDETARIIDTAHTACMAPSSVVLSGSSAGFPRTTAGNATGLYPNATITSGGPRTTPANTEAATTEAPTATGTPAVTAPNMAGRSEFGMVALGIALAAALAL